MRRDPIVYAGGEPAAIPLRAQATAWAAAAARGQPLDQLVRDEIAPAWRSVLDAPPGLQTRAATQWLQGVLALGRWALAQAHDSAVPPLAARLIALSLQRGLHLELWLPMDGRLAAASAWSRGVTRVMATTGVAHRIDHHLWPEVAQRNPAPQRALWCWGCLSMLPASDLGGAP
jgi:hypothetical protein